MTELLKQKVQEMLESIQGGIYWDEETRLENMIKILEEVIRKTISDDKKTSSSVIKLQMRLLVILRTLEDNGFDVHTSSLEYIIPGVHNLKFTFKGFSYDAVLNFVLVTGNEESKESKEFKDKSGIKRCSYKFVYIDDMQENLLTLVDKFSKTKRWRNQRDTLMKKNMALV